MIIPPYLNQFAEIIIDSYFIVDLDFNIVDFNRAFHSMLPRAIARSLKTKKCYEVLQLNICKENCIAKQCRASGRQIRLDEISGKVVGEEQEYRFILSAIPLRNEQGEIIGVMEIQRNVTDEALVQNKYQQQMDASAKQQQELERELQLRTKRLLDVSRRLYEAQVELLKIRTELFG